MTNLIEISVQVDTEAAEAVSELFNRYNGGDWDEDSAEGEASGGGAVIEATGFDDFHNPLPDEYVLRVKTYLKPGARGERIQRQIEEGLWRLSLLYPIPEPEIRTLTEEDWAHAWKKFYKPLRVGKRVVLKPSWEAFEAQPDDILIELDPGMAFGTGLAPQHPAVHRGVGKFSSSWGCPPGCWHRQWCVEHRGGQTRGLFYFGNRHRHHRRGRDRGKCAN